MSSIIGWRNVRADRLSDECHGIEKPSGEKACDQRTGGDSYQENLRWVTPTEPNEVPSFVPLENRRTISRAFSPLPQHCRWLVKLRGVRPEVENDLEPPVWLVGDLNGSTAQVSLCAQHDVE